MSLGRFRFWRRASQIVRFATIAFATVTIHPHIARAPVLSSDASRPAPTVPGIDLKVGSKSGCAFNCIVTVVNSLWL
jgi:hypothetical protein